MKITLKQFERLFSNKLRPIHRKLDAIIKMQAEQTKILARHTAILDRHTAMLARHSQLLKERGKALTKHTKILGGLSNKYGKLNKSLNA